GRMRICLIAEGAYPYVTGGVSSWIQSLVTGMPEHEFVLYAIGAEEELRGKFKYRIPDNLVEIREVFLDAYQREENKARKSKAYALTSGEKAALISLLGDTTIWNRLFYLMAGNKIDSVTGFLSSGEFLD